MPFITLVFTSLSGIVLSDKIENLGYINLSMIYSVLIKLRQKFESYKIFEKSKLIDHDYDRRDLPLKNIRINLSFIIEQMKLITTDDVRYLFNCKCFQTLNPFRVTDDLIRSGFVAIDLLLPNEIIFHMIIKSYRWEIAIDDIRSCVSDYFEINVSKIRTKIRTKNREEFIFNNFIFENTGEMVSLDDLEWNIKGNIRFEIVSD